MLPRWYHLDEIPFESMWADDRRWFPIMFANEGTPKVFKAYYLFQGHDVILEEKMEVLDCQ